MVKINVKQVVKKIDSDTVEKLEDLRELFLSGRREIPIIVDIHCNICERRTYAFYIGITVGMHNLFEINYNCELCDDTKSLLLIGDKNEYYTGD